MRRFIVILLVALTVMVAEGATRRWERIDTPVGLSFEYRHSDDENEDVDVAVAVSDGYIYLVSQEPVEVRVFTILGQLLSQEKLGAGVHRFHIKSRGIYILKIGSLTRRVTI
ncbi:MAG: T9SS type A sorting domain-containing protein [Duncaniella sp.]|nr:T9SS type A sorting domain-containing protein [Duncaniella sp.]MDE7146694.1 T9SS type A sorting domain-containing protein [Duncaniella sp.]